MSEQKLPLRANNILLPTLFDRLRDDAPSRKTELPDEFTISRQKLRDIIQRDLAYLLNSINKEDILDTKKYPEVAKSCMNYGIPALAGRFHTAHSWTEIEQRLRKAIILFEPRISSTTLQIIPLMQGTQDESKSYNTLAFELRGSIYCNPYPLEFVVQSTVDLESNLIQLKSISVR